MRRREFVAALAMGGSSASAGCFSMKSAEDYEREGKASDSDRFFQSVLLDDLTGETVVTVADDLILKSEQGRGTIVADSISVVRDGRLVGQVQTVSSVSEYEFPYLTLEKYVLVARGIFMEQTVDDYGSIRHFEVSAPVTTEDVTIGEETVRVVPSD